MKKKGRKKTFATSMAKRHEDLNLGISQQYKWIFLPHRVLNNLVRFCCKLQLWVARSINQITCKYSRLPTAAADVGRGISYQGPETD